MGLITEVTELLVKSQIFMQISKVLYKFFFQFLKSFSGFWLHFSVIVNSVFIPLQALDDPNNICISQRNFAIGIAIAGLILMLMVVAAFLILLARRRSRKEISTTGSSIYSGPYTNTAYSHSSQNNQNSTARFRHTWFTQPPSLQSSVPQGLQDYCNLQQEVRNRT